MSPSGRARGGISGAKEGAAPACAVHSAGAASDRAIRVLYVVPGLPQGHNMVFARDAAQALRESGFQVDEFYLRSRTALWAVLQGAVQLRREIRRQAPDIVHAQYGGVTALVAALATRGRPLVVSVRGSDLNRVPSVHPLRSWLTRLMTQVAVACARKAVCVSSALAQQLWLQGRAVVIPSGVDMSVFRPSDRDAARLALGWSATRAVVLFNAGQAPEQKGLPLVQQAVQQLIDNGTDLTMRVVRGGLSRPEMAVHMAAADCLVMASQTEGSPNVVKEAMACNLPVVSVPVGDVVQRLGGVAPGAIVAPSADAIAAAVAAVLKDRRRSNGRAAVLLQGLSVDDTTAALQGVYRELVSCQGGGPR